MEKMETLIEQIHEILQDAETGFQIDGTRNKFVDKLEDPIIFYNNRKLATDLIYLIGEDLINYLVNEGYISSKLEDLVKGEEPYEYTKAIGLIPCCKCRICGGNAYQIDKRFRLLIQRLPDALKLHILFHCESCGNYFKEEICPECGSEMERKEPKKGEAQFTPFWTCPECHYHTEASR